MHPPPTPTTAHPPGPLLAATLTLTATLVAVTLACTQPPPPQPRTLGTDTWGAVTEEAPDIALGRVVFSEPWTPAPDPTNPERDGLGPLMIAPSCTTCHEALDRGTPPTSPDDPARGLIAILHNPTHDGDPTYGTQLQDRAIPGHQPEGTLQITWTETTHTYPDGTPYTLRAPQPHITNLAHGPLHPDTTISLRLAPPLPGLGYLEQLPAPPEDQPGRFGWKATSPNLEHQTANAFSQDLGVTTTHQPQPTCPTPDTRCTTAPHGGTPELTPQRFQPLLTYLRATLPPNPPTPDTNHPGHQLFTTTGCATCHTPTHQLPTHDTDTPPTLIHPYTDLTLHDMGPGLADPHTTPNATRWRTPPLWGHHLKPTNRPTHYLHDGRATTIETAILWHGGEAQNSRNTFAQLTPAQRQHLIDYINTL